MNRVASRAFIVLVLVLGLLGGTGFFVAEYAMKADNWVMSAGSPHVDEDTGISLGYVTDTNGQILVALGAQRTYSTDLLVRRASLHWVGDRSGNIPSSPTIPRSCWTTASLPAPITTAIPSAS